MKIPGQSEQESVFHPLMVIACYSQEEDEACREELKNAGYVWCTGASADTSYYECTEGLNRPSWLRYFVIRDRPYRHPAKPPVPCFFQRTRVNIHDYDMKGYESPVNFADLFRKPLIVDIKIEDML